MLALVVGQWKKSRCWGSNTGFVPYNSEPMGSAVFIGYHCVIRIAWVHWRRRRPLLQPTESHVGCQPCCPTWAEGTVNGILGRETGSIRPNLLRKGTLHPEGQFVAYEWDVDVGGVVTQIKGQRVNESFLGGLIRLRFGLGLFIGGWQPVEGDLPVEDA